VQVRSNACGGVLAMNYYEAIIDIKNGKKIGWKRAEVKKALRAIDKGSKEETIKGLRPDLKQFGGTADITLYKGKNSSRGKGYGVEHSRQKHGGDQFRAAIEAMVDGKFKEFDKKEEKVILSKNKHWAIMRMKKDKKSKSWFLTGYKRKNKKTDASGEGTLNPPLHSASLLSFVLRRLPSSTKV
jgi:hypothetical protein